MKRLIKTFVESPGDFSSVNIFDALYSLTTLTLSSALPVATKVAERFGIIKNDKWAPGKKLKLLLLSYSGARNTGAEVRTLEAIDQMNKVLGDNAELNMLSLNVEETKQYLRGRKAGVLPINPVFFADVYKYTLQHHMSVLIEGSCWKENFASALLLYFLYGAAVAKRLEKPVISYGVDAGKMNKLNNFLSTYLTANLDRVITRSEDSARLLVEELHFPKAVVRVDTAWTVKPASQAWAKSTLRKLGWDGKKPLVGFAFQNYFWWPVVPDFAKWIKSLITRRAEYQYKMVYFYDYGEEDKRKFEQFVQTAAYVLDRVADEFGAQPVLIAMEALDHESCEQVRAAMKNDALLVSCRDFVGEEMAALLRQLRLLITTRYHAMVLAMPGLVPFIGLSRDERIRGVMKEVNLYNDYYLDYREPELTEKLWDMITRLMDENEAERVRKAIDAKLPYYFAQMAMLGLDLREVVRENFPEYPLPKIDEDNPEDLLPRLPSKLKERTRKEFAKLKQENKVLTSQ